MHVRRREIVAGPPERLDHALVLRGVPRLDNSALKRHFGMETAIKRIRGLRQVEARHVPTDLSTLRSWTFITSHAQVLLAVARHPDASVVEIAEAAEITERSTYRLLADLQQAGYVGRSRKGRQNRYEINRALPLRDATIEHGLVRDLLKLVVEEDVEGHLLLRSRRA
jgi:DNA-binding MarR family transcriptional regulator